MGRLTPCNISTASGGQHRRSIIWVVLLLATRLLLVVVKTDAVSYGSAYSSVATRLLLVVVNTDTASYGSAYFLEHVSCKWWSTQTQHLMGRLTPCNMSPASGGQHRRSIIWIGLLLATCLRLVVVNTDAASYR